MAPRLEVWNGLAVHKCQNILANKTERETQWSVLNICTLITFDPRSNDSGCQVKGPSDDVCCEAVA